jgi:hypothetical protein
LGPARFAFRCSTIKWHEHQGDRILFLGDSLTYYGGIDGPKDKVTKGYLKIIQESLDKPSWSDLLRPNRPCHCGHSCPRGWTSRLARSYRYARRLAVYMRRRKARWKIAVTRAASL